MTAGSMLDLVEVGCTIYALDLNEQTDAEARQVKGGVVLAIETALDVDTGEVQRRFITATPWRRAVRFDSLAADQVAQVELPNAAAIRSLIRSMARVVADSKRLFTTDEARCVDGQGLLMRALNP